MTGSDITYRELAARTGLSAGYLNHIVHGNRPAPERRAIANIAAALGIAPDLFFEYRLSAVTEMLPERPDLIDDLFARTAEAAGGESGEAREMPESIIGASASGLDEEPDGAEGDLAGDQRPCVVPGCASTGKHKLGVRCRVWQEPSPVPGKSKTSALWAPDSDAFLCDRHALGGAHITLIYEPNDTGEHGESDSRSAQRRPAHADPTRGAWRRGGG